MKITLLNLKAYGHFTNSQIDLSSDLPGLHVICGSNETGKSTALRALRGLFYGINARTPDNFLHDYDKLMIGGHIENAKGESLVFWRRKRKVGDLLDKDMSPLDVETLNEFLAGVGEPLFDSLFGIDHETLVSGGRDILEQKGDVGQALFSAGAGLSSLHEIIDALDRECADLFKAGGSKPEINKTTKHIQSLKKDIRDLSLSANKWKEQKETFEAKSNQLLQAEQDRNRCRADLERLKRLQRAMSHLSKRRDIQRKLDALGSLDNLPENFLENLTEIRSDINSFNEKLRESKSIKDGLSARLADCVVRQELIDQGETVEALHQRLGAILQAKQDWPVHNQNMISCNTEAATLLNQAIPGLELSKIDEIRPVIEKRDDILKLGNQWAGLKAKLQQAEGNVDGIEKALETAQSELNTMPTWIDISGLSSAIKSARKTGDIDINIRQLELEIRNHHSSAETEAKQLVPWEGGVEKFLTLPVPSINTVNRFADDIRDASNKVQDINEKIRNTQADLDRTETDRRAMEKAGAVPTVGELEKVRDIRDKLWQIVRRIWLKNEDVTDELTELGVTKDIPDAYEAEVRNADDVSDNLRTEAERVHKYAQLLAQSEKYGEQIQRLKELLDSDTRSMIRIDQEWQDIWKACGIKPLDPGEMRGWIEKCQGIRRMLKDHLDKSEQRQHLIDHRHDLLELLSGELKGIGDDKKFNGDELETVIVYADATLEKLKEINDNRSILEQNIAEAQRDISSAKQELQASESAMKEWDKGWRDAMEGIRLSELTSPEEAVEVLGMLSSCLMKLNEAEGFKLRLNAMDESVKLFMKDVQSVVESVAPDIVGLSSEQAVVKLQSMLKEARHLATKRDGFLERIESTEEDIRTAKVNLERASGKYDDLQKTARCENDEQMDDLERRYREFDALNAEMIHVEETIAGIAEGVPLEELDKQSLGIDPNGLPGEIDTLERRLREELDPLIQQLSEDKGEARTVLQQMDGSGKAAEKQEETQQAFARVKRLANNYVRRRIASLVLKKEVDRYRKENQDPILEIASGYFSELTLGTYKGLRADIDYGGKPILVGVCTDDSVKTVEEMSSGTRDQLYLALRLATLKWRLDKHEPMPFIADDILVNFDDPRSEATLKVLASLAEENQVILFTHHSRIVESAKALKLDDRIFVHTLNASES